MEKGDLGMGVVLNQQSRLLVVNISVRFNFLRTSFHCVQSSMYPILCVVVRVSPGLDFNLGFEVW